MNYQVRTQKEIAEMNLLPEATYAFEIVSAVDKVSKASGRDMIQLDLSVFTDSGRRVAITDYLVPGTNFGDRKIFEFAQAVGLETKYQTGTFTSEDCLGRGGFCKVGIEKGKEMQNKPGEFFNDKNKVKFYTKSKPTPVAITAPQPTEDQLANKTPDAIDEDVPF